MELPPEQQKTLRDDETVREIYDFSLFANAEKVTNFETPTSKLTIGLPYTLKAGEIGSRVWVLYVAENGATQKMSEGRKYERGLAIFETNHLSIYVVTYEAKDATTPTGDDTPPNENDDGDGPLTPDSNNGDGCNAGLGIGMTALVACGICIRRRKR